MRKLMSAILATTMAVGMMAGAAIAHNFGLAGAADSVNDLALREDGGFFKSARRGSRADCLVV